MICISDDECLTLCKSKHLERCKKSLLYRASKEPFAGELPSLACDQSHFSRFVLELDLSFRGCLIWITDWGISPSEENPIVVLKVREAFGERRNLIDAPGHLFDANEAELATALVRLVLAFAWDAHIVHLQGGISITLSHDGWFEVSVSSVEDHERIARYMVVEPNNERS